MNDSKKKFPLMGTPSRGNPKRKHMNVADDINRLHALVVKSESDALDFALQCGELLHAQKKRCEHGEWQDWVRQNCNFSHDTANVYMRAVREKTSGLVFSSLREMKELTRDTDKVAAKPKPKPGSMRAESYLYSEFPPPDLPAGIDPNDWGYANDIDKSAAKMEECLRCWDNNRLAQGVTPELRKKLRATFRRIMDHVLEADRLVSGIREPLARLPIEEQRELYRRNDEAEVTPLRLDS